VTKFAELETRGLVDGNVIRALTVNMGLETMTEVQSATIHEALKGVDM
jgi:ATP-dependent RNA helicase MSS116